LTATEDGNGNIAFTGTMQLKGITKEIQGIYSVNKRGDRITLIGAFDFDRSKYDIRYRSASFFDDLGDKMIYDDVTIGFEIELV
ncbi:MAG: YceI family protein, partial [Cryomorphaceae bacterium]